MFTCEGPLDVEQEGGEGRRDTQHQGEGGREAGGGGTREGGREEKSEVWYTKTRRNPTIGCRLVSLFFALERSYLVFLIRAWSTLTH